MITKLGRWDMIMLWLSELYPYREQAAKLEYQAQRVLINLGALEIMAYQDDTIINKGIIGEKI